MRPSVTGICWCQNLHLICIHRAEYLVSRIKPNGRSGRIFPEKYIYFNKSLWSVNQTICLFLWVSLYWTLLPFVNCYLGFNPGIRVISLLWLVFRAKSNMRTTHKMALCCHHKLFAAITRYKATCSLAYVYQHQLMMMIDWCFTATFVHMVG